MKIHQTDEGFTLVEIVISTFLLAIVAVALLPALWSGIMHSSRESARATATRELNALVETARDSATCAGLTSVAVNRQVEDGAGGVISTSGVVGTCPAVSKTVKLALTAKDVSGRTLATATAIIYVP